jgi:hypothetical protein
MWRGAIERLRYARALAEYGKGLCEELNNRRMVHDKAYPVQLDYDLQRVNAGPGVAYPEWWGLNVFHAAHRANLMRKDLAYYSQHFSDDPSDVYVWPLQRADGSWVLREKQVGARKYYPNPDIWIPD